MKTDNRPLPPDLQAQLDALERMPDSEIDFSDAPERLDWSGAKRGLFYRPIKKQVTVRFDADVLDWFRHKGEDGKGYQTRMNAVLREYMLTHLSEGREHR